MKHYLTVLLLMAVVSLSAQTVEVEGYVFEDNNRGFLNEVVVKAYDATNKTLVAETVTNLEGLFRLKLPANKDFSLKISKDLFFPKEELISTKGKTTGETVYSKIKLERKPGYIFDVTLAESGAPTATVDAITGAKIEVFNNTKMEEALVIDALDGINFDVTFERGNHYTVLIRKEGYFNKKLEAYVDVEGCILCFEGVGKVTPGVSDVMSEGFQMGSVLANIELEPATLNRTIEVENIYYDLDKYYIRDDAAVELDKVVTLLKENPSIIIELGSHTDSRGGTRYNKKLSTNRAKAAVEYIIKEGGISPTRISYKGYGETQLVNNCTDGKKCTEAQHQENRRTELKIVGFQAEDPFENRSLADMLIEEKLLREVENSEQIQVKSGEVPDFDKLSKTSTKSTGPTKSTNVSQKVPKNKVVSPSVESPTSATTSSAPTTQQGGYIRSASSDLVVKANQVIIVKDGKALMMDKMIGNQLNKNITDMMLGKTIYLEQNGQVKTYEFDSIDKMPMDILNVFLGELALKEKSDGWQLFPIEKGNLPKEIQQAFK
ncbi:MAG: OmpA family protein [Bacteroidota bacterium]